MVMIKTDLGNYLPVNEWLKYYADLLRGSGYTEEQIDFRVELKKAEFIDEMENEKNE